MLRDGLAQGQDAQARGVLCPAVLDGARERLRHRHRRLEIRLPVMEVHHVDAGALESLGALRHFHGEERLDLAGTTRRTHERRTMRRRALRICQSIPGPSLSTPTLLPGWSVQFTAASAMR